MEILPKAEKDWGGFYKEAKFAFLFDHLLFTKNVDK